VRGPDGSWRVLADRTAAPSGIGYARENRRLLNRVLPELFRSVQVRQLRPFFDIWQDAMHRLAPAAIDPAAIDPGAIDPGAIDTAALPIGFTEVHQSLAPGATATVTVKAKAFVGLLKATTYSLYGLFRDLGSEYDSVSAAGPTLTVPPPLIKLSAKQTFSDLPATLVAGAASGAVDKVKVTNTGTDPSVGTDTVTLYLSSDGTAADGTALASVQVSPKIGHGGSTVVPVPLGAVPSVAAGSYEVVATVTDPNQVVTSSAASAPVTVTAGGSTTGGAAAFTVALTKTGPIIGADPDTEEVTLIRLTPTVTFTNTSGAAVHEPVTLTYYFSGEPTFVESDAEEITSSTVTLTLTAHGKRTSKYKLTTDVDLGHAGDGTTEDDLYYTVVATDASGDTATSTDPQAYNFDL